MARHIVVLGGGTGGTLLANRLRKRYDPSDVVITVVDQDDQHVYQPGLLFVPFGMAHPDEIVRSRHRQLHGDIGYLQSPIERVDLEAQTVHLSDSTAVNYDVLVVATGARLIPEETEGLAESLGSSSVGTFYDLAGATDLARQLASFDGGRLVVDVVDLPIKCPVAPLEFCFLADWYFSERGIRDRVEITYVTPLDAAFTKPIAAATLGSMLDERGIGLVTEFNCGTVEADEVGGRLVSYDERAIPFDLAVVVPLHGGAEYVANSDGLGDELGFIPTDEHTLQSKAAPNVFVIGDAANLPASKAGSVTHFEGDVLADNIVRFLAGEALDAGYDGHANCFIETGFGKALLIDFNYENEPVSGHFPGRIGLPLLKESRMNHLGKLMFQWFYWHTLLPGRDVPGVGADMPLAGKNRP